MTITITARTKESVHRHGRSGFDEQNSIDETKVELILDGGRGNDGLFRSQIFVREAVSQEGEHAPAREFVVLESASSLAGRVGGTVQVESMSPSEAALHPANRISKREAHAKLSEIASVQLGLNLSAAVTFKSGRELWVSEPPSAITDLA